MRLSHTQRGLWFLHRLHPGSTAYHMSTLARVVGAAPVDSLRAVFQKMVDRHPALRTTFPLEGDEPVQVIPERAEVAFEAVEASGWSGEELRAAMEEVAFRPFDLERGPIFRATVFVRGAERWLVASMHHIVSDFTALVNLLQAPREGTKSFAEFVDWQAEMLAGPEGERLEAYWRERLDGLPELDLPADRVKPAQAPEQAGAVWRTIGPAALGPLKALARAQGATLYVVLLAAFQALLSRYTGQDDFAVGSPVAGRPVGYGRVAGYFTNPVVLRADLAGDPPFRELVDRTRRRVVEALDHQHFPLPLLVERLRARAELFRALFVLHKAPAGAEGLVSFSLGEEGGRISLDGFELESIQAMPRGSQFDLTLAAGERQGSLGLQIIYDAARFDAPTLARWLQHLDHLLAGVASDPDIPVSDLPLLAPWERHHLLAEVNDGGAVDLPWSTLHEGFERQARETPQAIALIDGERRLTYADLDARATALAEDLRRRGAGPETVVAVKLPRTAELIAALLGVLEAGAAYLPLDPAYPEERIAFMLEDAGAGWVIGPEEIGRIGPIGPIRPISTGKGGATPLSLAYLIYTSGSTGRPKGVAIEHAAAVRLVAWARRAFSPAELAGVLAATSVNFDLSIFEIFVPLSSGGTVILAANALALPELPARGEVTLLNTVPSAIAGLLEMGPLPASVRTVNLAGEPLRRALADQVIAAGVKLWDLYGPSEDTTYSTGAVVTAGDSAEPLIGWPLAGSRAYVLGRRLEPLPLGVPGELFLGGGGLARGYLGRPALTAEKFVPSPFGDESGTRLYRTGDLVRRRPDGALEYLGRLDHQVKIRGFRIELGEVEAALLALPGVREAVVVARDGSLAAYLALEPVALDTAQPEEALREALRQRLPAPFVPSFFVVLDALPRTPNGKVDRKALPAPASGDESPTEAPVGPVEEAVAAVWAAVLGRERIGRSERFFELGGHSLLAARVMARLRQALGVDLPLTALFDAPTVAGLAARVAAARASVELPLRPVPRDRPLPLSFAQERLWFLDHLEPGSPLYNIPVAFTATGPLDPALLESAFTAIEHRHEALRTVIRTAGGAPVQEIRPARPFALPVVDLSGLPAAVRRTAAAGLREAEARRPFDLERGPVWRALCLRLNVLENEILLTLHHIAGDGWSLEVLEREVETLYGGETLPPLPVQPADAAVWQRARLAGAALQEDLAWWRTRLAGAAPLDLPGDRPRPAAPSPRGFSLTAPFPPGLTADLHAFAHRHSAAGDLTLYQLLLAGFVAFLARWSDQRDLSVGAPFAGRGRIELEGLIGLFVNTLVLRLDLSAEPGFAVIAGRARTAVLEAQAHGEMPFERLVEELAPERATGRTPLVQAMFDLAYAAAPRDLPGGLRLERLPVASGTAKLDLSLHVDDADGALTATLEASADLFDRTTGRRLLDAWLRLLAAAVRAPEIPFSDLPLLAEAEQAQAVREWNDTAAEPPRAAHLYELFDRHVRERPGALALVWEEGRLTWAELAARVDPLAHHLRGLGVGLEVPVAFCLERGPGRIVALLAILKAGGAYVPLDPAWPAERLAWILEDCGAPVLITEEGLRSAAPLRVETRGPGCVPATQAAYVLYTSGSTGHPKGVVIEHRSAISYAATFVEELGLGPDDRMLQFASIGFDLSFEEIFAAFAAGAVLHVATAEMGLSAAAYLEQCRRWGLTMITPPTAFWHEITREITEHPEALPPSLRVVVIGGEAVLPERLAAWRRHARPEIRLVNTYGPTESTVAATSIALHEETWGDPFGVPIGRPFRHARAHVLDRSLHPVCPGLPGELCIGGAGVARGYLRRPELTVERFVPDPFAETPGARLYRTGDLARFRHDGILEYLGRFDHQVKIRGFRIELGEIEAALTTCPMVAGAAVLAPAGAGGERRLVAVIVPKPGHSAVAEEIRELLKQRFPDFMVPTAFVFLDALPLTSSGKVDRRALTQAALAAVSSHGAPGEAPRTPVEEVVAAVWSELLEPDAGSLGRHDSFFERGGHSLLAARVAARLREAFGIDVPVRDLFEAPTVAGLAARVEDALRAGRGETLSSLLPLAPEERAAGVPLSFAQRRLWFFERLAPGTALYHIPAVLRVDGPLDARRLERAFDAVARRQEALRTVFAAPAGEPLQIVLPPAPGVLPLCDLSGLPAAGRLAFAEALAAALGAQPFDLERGPLWRTVLFRLGEGSHLLLLSIHHIVSDGWSLGVLLREVAAFYDGGGAGLPDLPVQYADWAVWQQRRLRGAALDRGLAAWRSRLEGAPPLLALPTDRPRPAVQAFRGRLHAQALPAALADGLHALARHAGATPFMVLLAAFQALLARWSGRRDLVVGTPEAGRDRLETEGLIGFFVNLLPLRGRLLGDPPLSALVSAARDEVLAAYTHREIPFERLVEELAPERGLGAAPLVQVVLSLANTPRAALAFGGMTLTPAGGAAAGDGSAKFDLHLAVEETPEGLGLVWEFDADLFDAASIEDQARRFARLLAGGIADPALPLSELPLLDEAETAVLLGPWSGAGEACPPGATIPELFAGQVARQPEAVAAVAADLSLTRAELASRAACLAGRLRALGVGPETPVALRMERSPDLLVALLGVLESGGVAVPLDPAWPAERRDLVVRDAGAAWTLAEGLEIEPAVPRRSARKGASGGGGQPLPDHLACILYTSGSTGRPKGVGVTHRGIARLVQGVHWARLEGETFLLHSPLTFDASTLEIWGPLLNGGRLVIAPPGPLSPHDLGALIARHGVTSAWMTAALFHHCVEEDLEGLRPLRQLLAGGDVLSPPHCERVLRALPDLALINGYGPTENTTFTTTHTLRGAQRIAGPVPIGRPIEGTFVRVLDAELHLAAPGSPGELCAGGSGLARGYAGRPDLTAERFVPDPYAAAPGARLYRTGDLARWRPGGLLEMLGRLDLQVKVRGFRIEPGEIEAALATHPAVGSAAVLAPRSGPGDRRLIAWLTASRPVTAEELREHLRGSLPAYMVPSAFHVLDALPRTSHGKVDRRALERLGTAEEPAASAAFAERSLDPVEASVAAVWADVLDLPVERIGPRTDFFALGGHSLLATRVSSRLRQVFGVEVPLRDVLEQPTVEALAVRLRGTRGAAPAPAVAPPIVPLPRNAAPFEPPLSFAQLRLWILDRIEPGLAAYNVPLAVRLEGALEPPLLARAFGEVARRHEAVRTTFEVRGGDPVQIIHPPAAIPLPAADLTTLPDTVRTREARRLAQAEEARPFDLEHGPVLRAALLRLAPEEHVLLLTLHHVVCDEWSLRLLFREVVLLYAAYREGRPAALPGLPVQYADYAVWQRGWLTGLVLESQLAFWRSRLADPPVLELPTDRPRPPVQTVRGARLAFALPAATGEALRALAHHRGATAFMTLLAAFQALLARTAGQTGLTVGTPITGRTRAEVENLIGFFLNTLVIRADLTGDPGFGEMVDRARARSLEAFAHQDLPFEKLVDEIGARRSLGHAPLFQALFVLLHTAPLPEAKALRATPFATGGTTAKFDLTLALQADGSELTGAIEYNTDLFDRTTALRLAERFRVLCAGAVYDPERPLSALPVLPEAEAHQITHEWNDRPPLHDAGVRLHGLVAKWAEDDPERIAVEWEGGSFTYAGLVDRARALAGHLRTLGVGPDVPVGVYAERGPELAVAFLAVFEAGGAYLPIDPAYPKDRQHFMLEDSGAPVLLVPEALVGEAPETAAQVVLLNSSSAFPLSRWKGGDGRGGQGVRGQTAYVIYTSGSTGRPKGIAVPHRVLTNLILWQLDPARPGSMPGPWRTLQFSSPSFDVSLHEILSTWCAGGTLVLASEEDRRDPERLARRLAEADVERLFLPFVALQQLADRLARPETPVPGRLRRVITAGEQLQVTPQVVEAFRRLSAATGGTALHNHYGPSETHVVTELILEGDPARWPALPSIGRPISGVTAHVLDHALSPVPMGVPGELFLGGLSPARGYLGRPEQTAERFLPDPFCDPSDPSDRSDPSDSSPPGGGRLYRTGDRARLLPDGTIEFLGRIDHQVKIRGYRIEPGEIEAVLAAHPRVRECVVGVREDRPGDRRLVAWVVADGDLVLTDLRDHLRKLLPDPMVPTVFVVLDALPLTGSGKVQRSALPAPEGERQAAAPYVEPRSTLEKEIAAVFSAELGLDRVGREDNFFDLGGHSLTMVRAAARLSEHLGRPVAVLDLFRTPTVASLARQLGGTEEALPARETLEERAETRRQALGRRRELRRR